MRFIDAPPVLYCQFCAESNAAPWFGAVVCGRAACLHRAMDCPCPPADNPDKPPLCQVQ